MGIARRHRPHIPDKENLSYNRESRPWDNNISRDLPTKPNKPPPPNRPSLRPTQMSPSSPSSTRPPMGHVSVSDRRRLFEDPLPLKRSPLEHPLQVFSGLSEHQPVKLRNKSSPTHVSPLKTRLGNRELKPLYTTPNPPPLVGLPIPSKRTLPQQPSTPEPDPIVPLSECDPLDHTPQSAYESLVHVDVSSESSDGAHVQEEASNMTFEDPQLMPRFSYRHSVRLPSVPHPTALDELKAAPRSSFRHSRRIPDNDSSRFKCLPRSSSFMDFHDGQSLAPLDDEGDTKSRDTPGVWSGMSFEDADSFDTFGTLPSNSNLSLEHKQEPIMPTPAANATSPRPISDESEKPIFPAIPLHRNKPEDRPIKKHGDEEEDGTLDVPRGLVHQPGAQGALRDLQRASVTAGNEIATSLRLIGDAQQKNGVSEAKKKSLSRVQGDILLRSRIFRRWNVRYASIIHQGYFGAVLLLFRPEQRSTLGGIALRNSKMIALTETSVRKVENAKRPKPYMFELKTSQRTYTFACNEESGRDFWMSKLKGHGS